jgi:hypothetical protein
MWKKFLLFSLLLGTIHFGLSILAIAKGFYLFSAPSGMSAIFWQNAMNALLFPANVLVRWSGSQLEQTLAVVLNSLFCGTVVSGLYFGLRKVRSNKKGTAS